MEFRVVGLPYYDHLKVRDELKLGTGLFLVHDKGNPHSPNDTAVSVYYVDYMWKVHQIGHVGGDQSAFLLQKIEDVNRSDRVQFKTEPHISPRAALRAIITRVGPSSIRAEPLSEAQGTTSTSTTGLTSVKTEPPVAISTYAGIPVDPNYKPKKEETKMTLDKIMNNNTTVAVTAAYLEAGRIANNQVAKIVALKAPLMVRGYVDTPIGKLVLANAASMAAEQFRPLDAQLKKVTNARMANAYQDLIRTIDIEGFLNEITSSEGVKAALAAVAGQETQS